MCFFEKLIIKRTFVAQKEGIEDIGGYLSTELIENRVFNLLNLTGIIYFSPLAHYNLVMSPNFCILKN